MLCSVPSDRRASVGVTVSARGDGDEFFEDLGNNFVGVRSSAALVVLHIGAHPTEAQTLCRPTEDVHGDAVSTLLFRRHRFGSKLAAVPIRGQGQMDAKKKKITLNKKIYIKLLQ